MFKINFLSDSRFQHCNSGDESFISRHDDHIKYNCTEVDRVCTPRKVSDRICTELLKSCYFGTAAFLNVGAIFNNMY